ncbi:hypothetical protein [Singulisphaera sp. PoT]|uniref:hypothetical protein n=1 Tax=Singulisphaera sp. PoT TaxID=3411797 RepID=UPI003BF506BF
MTHPSKPLNRFRPRGRHILFLLIDICLVIGLLVPLLRQYGFITAYDAPLFLILVAPWVLVMLFLVLERQGPAKYWAALVLLSFCLPALAVYHNRFALNIWGKSESSPTTLVSVLINFVLIGGFLLLLIAISPERCPRCGRRTLIPLIRFWGRGKRSAKTRWCGSCGAQYWRIGRGVWQKERRFTWVDELNETKAGEAVPRPHDHKPIGRKSETPPPPASQKNDETATP